MQELSLNILDIAENSVKAGASLITVAVCYRPAADRLTVTITDDGCGMDAETVRKVTDPFYTTRTTRRVGLGVPFFKMAAQMAGLGWIGKNCSLISPQNGPRLRLGTVLTDAPLEPDSPIENRCGDCTQCRDICPAGAILGKAFDCNDALSQRFDFKKCDAYLSETRQTFGKRICGRCIAVCPYGRKKHAKEGQ